MSFTSLGLRAELLRAVAEQGYSEPTPIQCQAIPPILAGRDLMGGAQTGTGKTAGFTLPLLQRLMDAGKAQNSLPKGRRPIRALVLTPTQLREDNNFSWFPIIEVAYFEPMAGQHDSHAPVVKIDEALWRGDQQ